MSSGNAQDSPPTELGRLRVLSSTAGIRVSPLILGGGNIGQAWSQTWGAMTKDSAFALLDAFVEVVFARGVDSVTTLNFAPALTNGQAGGNWIDTANGYQNEESELWIGEWMAARNNRDQLVLSTKFTSDYAFHALPAGHKGRTANHGGNSRRSLAMSVRDSLRKLQTDFLDVLYVHWWDYTTSVAELMDSLHHLVAQGRVLYLGASDAPAWLVAAANTYAVDRGRTPFSVYQGRWNVLQRDLERDVLPMARHFGMAIAPWGVLGAGKFQTPAMQAARAAAGEGLRAAGGPQTEEQERMSAALARVGEAHDGASVTAVALAYILRKGRDLGVAKVFPVVGGRRPDQLRDNIRGLGIRLTDEQMAALEAVKPFEAGFPVDFVGGDPSVTDEAPWLERAAFLNFR